MTTRPRERAAGSCAVVGRGRGRATYGRKAPLTLRCVGWLVGNRRMRTCHARGVDGHALEIVVIHHRTPTVLAEALERLARHAPTHHVTVVDTAFDASLPHQLDGVHPDLAWRQAPNHSYAHAANVGLRGGTTPLVALMNADVWIGPSTFDDLVAPFDDPSVALTGPLARTRDGRLQDLGLPYRRHAARLRWAGGTADLHARPPASVVVPWLSGCLFVVRRTALARVGGMDGGLRFTNEDVEWAGRLRSAGFVCRLVATDVVHLGGASHAAGDRFVVEGLRGGYALSRRTQPRAVRAAHRWGVAAFATVRGALARDDARRRLWREVRRRFVHHDLDASPFGATLATDADRLTPPAGRGAR